LIEALHHTIGLTNKISFA